MMELGLIVQQIVVTAGVVGLIIVAAIFLLTRKQYPYRALIFEYRGGLARIRFTRARRIIKDGKEMIQLKDTGEFVPPHGYLETTVDRRGRTWIVLINHAPKEYAPVAVNPGTKIKLPDGRETTIAAMIPKISPAQKMAYAEALELSYKVYHEKTWMEKAMPFIYIAIIFVVVVASLQIMSGTLAEIAKTLSPAIDKLAEAMNQQNQILQMFGQILKQTGTVAAQTQATPPPPA